MRGNSSTSWPRTGSFLSTLTPLLFSVSLSQAAGLLVPSAGGAPLAIQDHLVRVDINNNIAVTEVVQVFRNDSVRPLEAVYSFPLPPSASLAGFSMWINGEEVTGEVLERDRAREIYQEIVHPAVRAQDPVAPPRDPGLVEAISSREYQVTIFPVPAHGTQKVRVLYYQYLSVDADRVTYVYPMETRGMEDSRARGRFSLDVELRSAVPLTGCVFPSHSEQQVVTEVFNPHRASAHLARPDGDLDQDFVMVYSLGKPAAGLDLITFRKEREDGYFLLLASAPLAEMPVEEGGVDYTFIVDVSGSMRRARKLEVAGEAIVRFLSSCGSDDHFNVIAFNLQPSALSPTALPNDSQSLQQLTDFLREFRGVGGTDLYPALQLAHQQADTRRKQAIIVITDGGLNDRDEGQARFLDLVNLHDATLFGLAVGNEANVPLLDSLARASGGFVAAISTQENLLDKGKQLRDRMRQEPLRNLRLEMGEGGTLSDVTPGVLPALYPGGQIAILGRYRGKGFGSFHLRGTRAGQSVEFNSQVAVSAVETLNPEIRRMWAERRVQDILQEMRAAARPETDRSEIIRLGTEYSIVTPYTSFLVLESDKMFRDYGIERRTASLLNEETSGRAERSQRADDKYSAIPVGEKPKPVEWNLDLGAGASGPEFLGLLTALLAGRAMLRRRVG